MGQVIFLVGLVQVNRRCRVSCWFYTNPTHLVTPDLPNMMGKLRVKANLREPVFSKMSSGFKIRTVRVSLRIYSQPWWPKTGTHHDRMQQAALTLSPGSVGGMLCMWPPGLQVTGDHRFLEIPCPCRQRQTYQ